MQYLSMICVLVKLDLKHVIRRLTYVIIKLDLGNGYA